MKRIAIIGAVLEQPHLNRHKFNDTISEFRNIVKGHMGTPFNNENINVFSVTVMGDLNEINALTGRLGNIPHVTVKAAVSGTLLE